MIIYSRHFAWLFCSYHRQLLAIQLPEHIPIPNDWWFDTIERSPREINSRLEESRRGTSHGSNPSSSFRTVDRVTTSSFDDDDKSSLIPQPIVRHVTYVTSSEETRGLREIAVPRLSQIVPSTRSAHTLAPRYLASLSRSNYYNRRLTHR